MITREIEVALQESMIAKLEELGVDAKHPGFAMVVILVEPKGIDVATGLDKATMHLGSYHCDDDDVLELLAEAPNSVKHTQALQAAEAERQNAEPS